MREADAVAAAAGAPPSRRPAYGAAVGVRLPDPCLVVLVGVAGAGKSTWAGRWFEPASIVSSDDLRAVVGRHRHDLRATKDATEVLELIVAKRLRRGLLTVIDSTALDPAVRARYRRLAAAAGVACHAVVVDTPERETRARNRSRPEAVPSAVVTSQLRALPAAVAALASEPFDGVHRVSDGDEVAIVPRSLYDAPAAARRQQEDPMTMRFGLQIGGWSWPGGAAELAPRLGAIARAAEEVGFSSISVMDHFVQIPTVGREWEDMPESTTTLGFLAAATTTAPPRRARQRHHVPQPGPPRQDRRHPRRAVGRSGVLRARHGVVRARARAVRLARSRPSPAATSCSRTPSSCCR